MKQIIYKAILFILPIFLLGGKYSDRSECVPVKKEKSVNVFSKGVWMWGNELSSTKNINTIVNNLSDNKINDVYLLVKGISGTDTPEGMLKDFIKRAHSKKIKVHFWYIVGNDRKFLSSHPDAHIYHCPKPSEGHLEPYKDTGDNVNLLYPGYKDYVLEKIKFFLTNYDCDGIHLDVIRFPNLTFSFDKYSLQKAESLECNTKRLLSFFTENYDYYVVKGGVTKSGFVQLYTSGDADVVKWVDMRKNLIHDYIKSIKTIIQELKPNISYTAAFMPEAALEPDVADVYYAQSYALNSPLLDAICPMAYFKAFNKPTSWLKSITQGAIKQMDPKCKLYTGIQTYDGVNAQQVKEQIIYSIDGGANGIVVFRYGTTTAEHWKVIKTNFKILIK